MVKKIVNWTIHWATTPYGPWALFFLAFAESSFFPIPPDVLLIALSLISPEKALWYATVCMFGSAMGGMLGYYIGLKGGRPLLERFVSPEKINTVHNYFEKYEEWAIGIAGFTPIPYKVFTIAGGAFYINFKRFVVISFLSRGARFYLVAGLIMLFGEQIKDSISRYSNLISVALVAAIVLGFLAMKKMPKMHKPNVPQPAEKE